MYHIHEIENNNSLTWLVYSNSLWSWYIYKKFKVNKCLRFIFNLNFYNTIKVLLIRYKINNNKKIVDLKKILIFIKYLYSRMKHLKPKLKFMISVLDTLPSSKDYSRINFPWGAYTLEKQNKIPNWMYLEILVVSSKILGDHWNLKLWIKIRLGRVKVGRDPHRGSNKVEEKTYFSYF